MSKSLLTAMACAVALAPAALAETGDWITVELEYDAAQLSTPEGAADVIDSLETQARRACTRSHAIKPTNRVDEVCADDLTAKGIAAIKAKQPGAALAGLFSEEPATVLAALEQR